MTSKPYVIGVILAGGQGKRMGGLDKGEVILAGHSLAVWSFMGLSPQVDQVVVNAPTPLSLDAQYVPDEISKIKGPLAGLMTALTWGKRNMKKRFAIITVAVDTPFFPDDLVAKLSKGGIPALASIEGEAQTTFGFWPMESAENLKAYMTEVPNPSIRGFAKKNNMALVPFKEADQFFNINTPQDLEMAESMVGRLL